MGAKRLIVVVGATAAGKTSECVKLSQTIGAEIVSADSRQFYKELSIGVARPTEEELKAAPHHLVAHISIHQAYNVAQYEEEALAKIRELFKTNDNVILSGGSGLYVQAVCSGLDDIPPSDNAIREELNAIFSTQGISPLQEELKLRDPQYYDIVDTQNHIRLIRALEVCRQSGRTYTSFRTQSKAKREFDIVKFGVGRSRENLLERIYKRVDLMIEQGLVEEARSVLPFKQLQALNTVGYKEVFEYLEGKITLSEAIERIKINTRRYAKRQMTWFCKDKEIQWLNAEKGIEWSEVIK